MTNEHNAADNLTPANAPDARSTSESPESLEDSGIRSDSSRRRVSEAVASGCLIELPVCGAIGSSEEAGSQSETQGQLSSLSQQPDCGTVGHPQERGEAEALETSATGRTSANRNAEIIRKEITNAI